MAKKRATKAKRTSRKKGLNLGVLRRGAKSRIKKLQDNIKKREKAIAAAAKRGDPATAKEHREHLRRARAVMAGLERMVKQMNSDDCPFAGQGDPLMS